MSCNEWKEILIIDCTDKIFSGGTPSTKKSEFWNGEYPWLSSGETRNTFITTTEKTITEEGIKNSSTKLAKKFDVVIASAGQGNTRGQASLCKIDTYINQSIIAIRSNKEVLDPYFLFYNIRGRYAELRKISDGHSIRGSLTTKIIKGLKIKLPPLEEQKAIAHILSTLDEKIEVNNKINKILEEMAQSIFKHWFIDFEFPNEDGEPYKSSGGEMVESELGMIPKGWEVVELGELFEDFIGGEWGKEKEDEKHTISVICIRGTDISELKKGNKGNIPTRFIKEKAFKKKRLKTGDIVIEISGGSPTQSTGRATYISKEVINRFNDRVVCTNFCRALRPKKTIFTELAYYFIEKLYKENVFFQYENGTTGIKNLDLNNVLSNEKLAIPKDMVIIEEFSKIINTISKKIQKNGIESEKLAEIRDTLLPKLMSGEIRVPLDN